MANSKMFLISCLVMLTLSVGAQTESAIQQEENEKITAVISNIKTFPIHLESDVISLKRIEKISADPHDQNKAFNHGKSYEIISIKAYMRKLQMKRKETLMS